MHMIMVLKQSEMIPKVPRRFGSASQLYDGLLGAVELVAGFSIGLSDQSNNRSSGVKSVGFNTATKVVANR